MEQAFVYVGLNVIENHQYLKDRVVLKPIQYLICLKHH